MFNATIDFKEFTLYKKFNRRLPYVFQGACAGTLNQIAFGTQKQIRTTLQQVMTIRQEAFVRSKIIVTRAKATNKIKNQYSKVGSIPKERFSGWDEQQKGTTTRMKRTPTKLSRDGSYKNTIRPKYRLKTGNSFINPKDFPGDTPRNRAIAMMNMVGRKGYFGTPLLIVGHGVLPDGLYILGNLSKATNIRSRKTRNVRVAHRVQTFKKPLQPRKKEWMTMALNTYFSTNPIAAIWPKEVERRLSYAKGGTVTLNDYA